MNELIEYKSWGKRNWKWLVPLTVIIITFIGFIASSKGGKIVAGNLIHITKAYSDISLHENALEIARKNEEVITKLGKLEPLDKLAIFEGTTKYSNNDNAVEMHIRVRGEKGKAKIDIYAFKKGNNWEYKKINIRIKEPKQTIIVL